MHGDPAGNRTWHVLAQESEFVTKLKLNGLKTLANLPDGLFSPGFPNTVPNGFISRDKAAKNAGSETAICSLQARSARRLLHSSSSFGEEALNIISYSWWSHSKTSFHEKGAV